MKSIIQRTIIATVLALLPFALNAEENKAAYDAVNASLLRGSAHADIIQALTQGPHDMTLSEATVFAMVSGGDSNRIDFVTAGITAAGNLPQAQSVANAVKAAAGTNSPEADAADAALAQYVKLMDQPLIHHDDEIPSGGGAQPVSPAT